MTEAVFAEGLTKSYGGRLVVDRLDLSVERGRIFGLLGANGAGKSTAIECILGTRQPDSGTIRLLGQDPRKHRSALFQRIGVQFQEGDYPPEIRVSELCRETASLYRRPADWHRLCREFGIGDNDTLSAIVAVTIQADLLILLSDIDGLFDGDPRKNPDAKLIDTVEKIDEHIISLGGGSGSSLGTGGMATKLRAAQMATAAGCEMVIANGQSPEVLYDVAAGKRVGTRFLAKRDEA